MTKRLEKKQPMSQSARRAKATKEKIILKFRAHFTQRALERYGLVVTTAVRNAFLSVIMDAHKQTSELTVRFDHKTSNARTVFIITYRGQEIKVVYHAPFQELITALPLNVKDDTDEQYEGDLSGL